MRAWLRPEWTRDVARPLIPIMTLALLAASLGGGWVAGPYADGAPGAAASALTSAPFLPMIDALDAAATLPAGAAVATTLRTIAAQHGVAVPERGTCPSLADALAAHSARLGVAAPRLPAAVPAEVDEALGCLLGAVHDANLAMDRTFDGVSTQDIMRLYAAAAEERPLDAALLALLEGRDHGHNLAAAIHAAETVDHATALLQQAKARGAPLVPLDIEPILRFEPTGDQVYDRNYALIVDLEGNDVYDNHAGGVFFAMGNAIYDVAEDSAFLETSLLGQNMAVGGDVQDADTVLSAGLVLDLAGDDTYGIKHPPMLKDVEKECTTEWVVPRVGMAGGGIIGIGMLFDLEGDDTYAGRTGAQGTGHILGVGVLYSGGGNDRFEAIRLAQGTGLLGGIGLLLNAGGHNTYLAQPPERGVFNGDLLVCDADSRYVQGAAFDRRPGPALPSVGILADLAGDTSYETVRKGHGFGQGPGLGLLYDRQGDDTYTAVELSQGAAQGRNKDTHAQAPWGSGYAVLFDRAGNDAYTLVGDAHGWRGQGYSLGHPEEPPVGPDTNALIQWAVDRQEAIGLLYDGGGTDTYAGPPGRTDDTLHTDGILGLFLDETS